MPEFTGRLRTPRLAAAPSSPVVGEMYYDTPSNTLLWWNGTSWVSASGGSGGGSAVSGALQAAAISIGGSTGVGNGAGGNTTVPLPLGAVINETLNGYFTRNADNSIQVAEAGWYQINALATTGTVLASSSPVGIGIYKNTAGSGTNTEIAMPIVESYYYGRLTVSAAAYLVPTDKLMIYGWSSPALTTFTLMNLSIARIGGIKGDKGDPGTVSDPGYRKGTGNVTQSAPGNNQPLLANAAGMPYLDLTPGTWRVRGYASTYANVADYVYMQLYSETDSAVIPGTYSAGSVNNTSASLIFGEPETASVITVTKTTRIRLYLTPAGSSTITINSGFCTTMMEAWLVGPGPQGPKGDTGGNATVPMDTWHLIGDAGEPAFTAGWVNYDNNLPSPGAANAGRWASFTKDPLGRVMLSGCVKAGTVTATMFTLPVGYRPAVGVSVGVGASGVAGTLNIATDGTVNCNPGSNAFTFLDGAIFDTKAVTQMPTGPQGPAGPAGGTMGAASARAVAQGAQVTLASGWNNVPLPTQMITEPADGFTYGTNWVAPKEAGWYDVNASIVANFSGNITIYISLSTGVAADGDVGNGGGTGAYMRVNANGIVKLAAGQRVYLYGYSSSASIPAYCLDFSISRVGGTQGPKGDTGGATVAMDPWHVVGNVGEPAYSSGWSSGGGVTMRFRKDPLGRVWVYGNANGPTAGGVAFVLPVGYRPARDWIVDNLQSGGTAGTYVQISASTGAVGVTAASGASYVDFNFDTETVFSMPTGPQGPAGPGVRGLVSVLPPLPQDGDECYYQSAAMATDGIVWHLRYRAASASAYRWEVIGASDLFLTYPADEFGPLSTWAAVTGMAITLPLAGDYFVRWGALLYSNVSAASSLVNLSLNSTTTPVAGLVAASSYNFQNVGYANYGERSREGRINSPTGAAVLRMLRQSGTSANGGVQNPWMRATPIRVGLG